MILQGTLSEFKLWLQRYWSGRVLAVWLVLTILIGGFVYVSVIHGLPYGPMLFGFLLLNAFVYGVAAVVIGGIVLAVWSHRPLYAFGSAVFVGFAALPITSSLGCPAVACTGAKHLHVFFEWTLLGPAVSASFDAGRCAYICPYSVELMPLTIGYLLIGETITQAKS